MAGVKKKKAATKPASKKRTVTTTPKTKQKRSVVSKEAKAEAKLNGLLPHEWLLAIARGEPMLQRRLCITYFASGPKAGDEKKREWLEEEYYADFATRTDAAKAAAPYYAPRLATQTITPDSDTVSDIAEALKLVAAKLPV